VRGRSGSIVLVLLAALAILAGTGAILLSGAGRKGPGADAGAGIERRALRREDGRTIADPTGRSAAAPSTDARPAGLRTESDADLPPVVEFPAPLLLRVLTMADRKPVRGARVEVRDLGSVSSGTCDDGGRLFFPRLEAGTVVVRVRAEGFCGEVRSIVLAQRDAAQQEEVLLWPCWTIEGTVVSAADGRPLPRARVRTVADDSMRGPISAATTTDDRGRFSFQGGRHGDRVTVAADAWGHLRRETRSSEGAVSPEGTLRFDLELDPEAVVSGVVRDPAGRPVAADVWAFVAGHEPSDPEAAWSYILFNPDLIGGVHARSGSDGRFHLDGLAAGGVYRVVALHPSHASSTEGDRVLVPVDGSEFRLDLSLRSTGGLKVTLQDVASGEPCAGEVFVHPIGVDPVANANRVVGHLPGGLAESPAVHEFGALPPGLYRVLGRGNAVVTQADATVVAGEVTAIDLVLPSPPAVPEPVTDPEGAGDPGGGVVFVNASGTDLDQDGGVESEWPSLRVEPVLPRGLVPRDGADLRLVFRLRDTDGGHGGLAWRYRSEEWIWKGSAVEMGVSGPGTGDLFVLTDGFLLGPIEVQVPPSGRVDLGRRELLDGSTIEGRVLDSQGRPLWRAIVNASTFDIHTGQGTTDRDGRFVLKGNFAGTVEVQAHAPGFQQVRQTAQAGPGSTPVEIRLPRWGTVRLRARSAAGVPLAGWRARIVPVEATGVPPDWDRTLDALGRVEFRVAEGAWRVEVRRERAGGDAGAEASADAAVQDEGVTVVDITGPR
jgi:hypothetical protein